MLGHNININFINILHVTVHVTAHVTVHVTVNKVDFTIVFYMLPHVTATFYKSITYIYTFLKNLQ